MMKTLMVCFVFAFNGVAIADQTVDVKVGQVMDNLKNFHAKFSMKSTDIEQAVESMGRGNSQMGLFYSGLAKYTINGELDFDWANNAVALDVSVESTLAEGIPEPFNGKPFDVNARLVFDLKGGFVGVGVAQNLNGDFETYEECALINANPTFLTSVAVQAFNAAGIDIAEVLEQKPDAAEAIKGKVAGLIQMLQNFDEKCKMTSDAGVTYYAVDERSPGTCKDWNVDSGPVVAFKDNRIYGVGASSGPKDYSPLITFSDWTAGKAHFDKFHCASNPVGLAANSQKFTMLMHLLKTMKPFKPIVELVAPPANDERVRHSQQFPGKEYAMYVLVALVSGAIMFNLGRGREQQSQLLA